jgi:hypothetical protein
MQNDLVESKEKTTVLKQRLSNNGPQTTGLKQLLSYISYIPQMDLTF